MSIASEITRLQGCKANIRTALVNKGITSASTHNMADFATDISNISAGGATITVTYNSYFYNKTMTCTNGSTTYTQTTTSSGSTSFNVTDEGTWTITCNGISRTVYVTLNYSTAMAVTKTITVYGAVGATISFTDAVGSKTVTLNSSGQGSVSISFIPPSQTITFTDTNKAKNPNNLSQNYSKSIAITTSTTSIKVMPDGAIYWYGWHVELVEAQFKLASNWAGCSGDLTFNEHSVQIHAISSGVGSYGFRTVNPIATTSQNKIKGHYFDSTGSSYTLYIAPKQNISSDLAEGSWSSGNESSGSLEVSCPTGNTYVYVTKRGDGGNFYAKLDWLFVE